MIINKQNLQRSTKKEVNNNNKSNNDEKRKVKKIKDDCEIVFNIKIRKINFTDNYLHY